MIRPKVIFSYVAVLTAAVALVYSTGWAQQNPTPPATAPGAAPGGPGALTPARGGRGFGGGGGGGGGFNPYGISGPLPGQAIYAANCVGCHGNDLTGGRAPT